MLSALGPGLPTAHLQRLVAASRGGALAGAQLRAAASRRTMGDAQQPKRPRLETAAEAASEAALARASPPPPGRRRPPPPPPPILAPPALPAEAAAWESAALLIDKPQGWTSFDVVAKLRGALAARLGQKPHKTKVGHAGTLDPMATGLLILAAGRGTKSLEGFMAEHKQYTGVLRLGEGTPSYDADSPVGERRPWEHITDAELAAAAAALTGDLQQRPPIYSAIRVGGQRLYKLARAGAAPEDVPIEPRAVTVTRFEVSRDAGDPQNVRFLVECSKGTYVRSLAADLGRALGSAAHLTALRRTASGAHRVEEAWQLPDLLEALGVQRAAAQQAKRAASGQAAAGSGQADGGAGAGAPTGLM